MGGGRVEPMGWIVLPLLGWIAGCAIQLQQPAPWPPGGWAILLGAAALALGASFAWRRRRAGAWLGFVAALGLGFGATAWRAELRLAEVLPAALEGQDLQVVGVIDELPRPGLAVTRLTLRVEAAFRDAAPVRIPRRLSLAWYRGLDADALLLGPADDLRAGQRWRLPVRLRQPHGALNPHGFDLELWLFERGLRATGYVRSRPGDVAMKLDDDVGHPIERARQRVREAIEQRVGDPAAAGVLAALAIGDQAAIERDDWDLFRATGIAHLMSISGLHVTMFAWLAARGVGLLWRRSERLMLWQPAPVAARWGGLALAALYALFAGWGVPAQRTVLMLAIVVLLRSGGRRWPLPLILLVAAVAVTLADPWALLQPGFWLSFVAVALLVGAEPVTGLRRRTTARHAPLRSALREALRTQAIATAGLTPLTLVFFQQVSVVGFVANLLAIPLVTLLITPLALLGIVAPPLWGLAASLVTLLTRLLSELALLPLAVWSAAAAPPWAVAAGLLAGLLAVLPLPWRLRALALPLALPLLAPPVPRPPAGQFEAVVADVGQGTAVLVRTRAHLLVYDAGPQFGPDTDAGARVLAPLLRARGEPWVDLLMLSHRDTDHVGGAASLMASLPVRELRSSLDPVHPLLARGVPHRRCEAGQRWRWDGVEFEVLHPTPGDLDAAAQGNALSCVLRIQGAGPEARTLLLTGDIEAAQERALLVRSVERLRSEVLVVPHHGSRTSSSPAFIDAVAPRVAVVQAAYRSRFGHPAPDVIERYAARGITVVRSARCGAWSLPALDAPFCERELRRRYWHHPGPVGPDP
jgi:competence protein ComEC